MENLEFPSIVKDLVVRETSGPRDNRGHALVKLTWFLIVISVFVVLARVWTKLKHAGRLFHDDALMIVAVLTGITHAVFVQLAVSNGYGRHMSQLTLPKVEKTVVFGAIAMLFGALSAMIGRIAFCCTLLFLIGTDSRMRAWPVYFCILIQLAINVTGVVVVFTQCGKNIDGLQGNTHEGLRYYEDYCANPVLQTYTKYVVGVVNTATDLYLAILPAVLINHTKLSTKAKLGLASLMCLSILAMAASGAKTYEGRFLQGVTDYTWSVVPYTICMSVELNIIIISASVPLLRSLFRRQKPPTRTLGGDTWPDGKHLALQSVRSSHSQGQWRPDSKSNVKEPALERILGDGIRVTTEIEVSYNSSSAPVIHANLVGLVPEPHEFAYPDSTDRSSSPRRRWWRVT